MFKDLFFALSNKELLNSGGQILSHDELLKLWEFYNLIKGGGYSRLIMRGEEPHFISRLSLYDRREGQILLE